MDTIDNQDDLRLEKKEKKQWITVTILLLFFLLAGGVISLLVSLTHNYQVLNSWKILYLNEQEKNVDQKEKIKEYGLTISDLEATNNKLKKRAIKCSDDLLENLTISESGFM